MCVDRMCLAEKCNALKGVKIAGVLYIRIAKRQFKRSDKIIGELNAIKSPFLIDEPIHKSTRT